MQRTINCEGAKNRLTKELQNAFASLQGRSIFNKHVAKKYLLDFIILTALNTIHVAIYKKQTLWLQPECFLIFRQIQP